MFTGNEGDFVYFSEQFEAKMHALKLTDALLDKIVIADGGDDARRTNAVRERDEKRYRVWCELIQCLDKKSVMFLRCHKPNGAAAWKALNEKFKSTERPRIHATMAKLTAIHMENGEKVAEYLSRAEALQMDLDDVGEKVSDAMFVAMVLKGLPREYQPIVTVVNYGSKKTYDEVKQDLINFQNTRIDETETRSSFLSTTKPTKCYNCGRSGHKQMDCRVVTENQRLRVPFERETRSCHNCGKVGHVKKDCRQKQREQQGRWNGSRNQHQSSNRGHYSDNSVWRADSSQREGDKKSFSFHSNDSYSKSFHGSSTELLIDSGCTGYMLKDKSLFVELDTDFKGQVGNANASTTAIEGRGVAEFIAEDSMGTPSKIRLDDAMFVPTYSKNLVSVKKMIDKGHTSNLGKTQD